MTTETENTPTPAPAPAADLMQGLAEIGAFLGCTKRRARHLCARGAIPHFSMGGRICARRSAITAHFAKLEAEALAEKSEKSEKAEKAEKAEPARIRAPRRATRGGRR